MTPHCSLNILISWAQSGVHIQSWWQSPNSADVALLDWTKHDRENSGNVPLIPLPTVTVQYIDLWKIDSRRSTCKKGVRWGRFGMTLSQSFHRHHRPKHVAWIWPTLRERRIDETVHPDLQRPLFHWWFLSQKSIRSIFFKILFIAWTGRLECNSL